MVFLLLILIVIACGLTVTWLTMERRRLERHRAEELRDVDTPLSEASRRASARRVQEYTRNIQRCGIGIVATTIGSILLTLFVLVLAMVYSQNPGEASVIVSFTGEVAGVESESGLHLKSPLDKRVVYDVRNNTLTYAGTDGNTDDYMGGDVSGPQVTFQDASGVTGNIDLTVRYSINGDSVKALYEGYKTQEEFVHSVLAPSVRSSVREVLAEFSTLAVYTDRNAVQNTLSIALVKDWKEYGVTLEGVYLQEVRYPDEVTSAFASAQSAQTKVEQAKAEQEKARVEAETNAIKAQGLTQPVLMEKLIDAIKNGNGTYVVDTSNLSISVK